MWHAALSTLLSAHQSIGVAEPLQLFGTEEQKRKWLPLVAKDHISAFLLTEADVGSDPARLATTATPVDGGYELTGQKLWATNGAIADIVVVMAQVPKSDGHRGGISAFVLPYDSDGVTVEHRNAFMGLRGIENSVTRLDHVFVPEENRIGREGEGLKIALTTLNTGRLALPAICVGMAKWSTKIAREWSNERVQWGRPIGKHDAVAQKIAFIAASAFGLEAMLDVASRLADDKSSDIRIEAALAKLYGSEMGWKVLDELIQVRGGRGLRDGGVAEGARREAGAGRAGAARHADQPDLRGLDRDHAPADRARGGRPAPEGRRRPARARRRDQGQARVRGTAGLFYSKWLPQLAVGKGQVPSSYDELGPLAPYMRFVERSSRKLARSTFYGMTRWQAKLEYRQAFLGRLVDIGAELFAMAAAAAYADTIGREQPARRTEAQELAELFCHQAKRRVETLFDELWDNDDDANRAAAARVLDGRYRWIEEGIVDPSGDGPMIPEEVKQPAAGEVKQPESAQPAVA